MRDIKNRKRWVSTGFLVLVGVLIGALVLTACAGGGSGGGGGGGGGGNETPSTPHPWIVRYARPTSNGFGSYIGIDPLTGGTGSANSAQAESLLHADPNTLEAVPGIATRWEINRPEMYVDFWLRNDVRFSNGDLVTAEDVKFSWDRCFDSKIASGWAPVFRRLVNNVEIVVADHIRVHYNEWDWGFATGGGPAIVPKKYIEQVGWEEWADKPVLTGPMKIVDWERDVSIHLVKSFPEEGHWYYGNLPNYDELIILCVIEPATRMAMLKAGEIDIASVPPANIPDVEADPNLTKVMSMYASPWHIRFYDVFYLDEPSPLQDPKVREAISLAIDREGIAKNVYHGAAEPWGAWYAPYHVGYRPKDPDTYDLTEARKLLTEAGYPDGFDTSFVYPLDRQMESQAVIASLRGAGIRAVDKPVEPTTWLLYLSTENHRGMGYMCQPWWFGATHNTIAEMIYDVAAQGTRNMPEIAEAYQWQLDASNEEEFVKACWAVEDRMWELNVQIPVWALHGAYAYRTTIKSWQPSPGSEYDQNFIYATYKG